MCEGCCAETVFLGEVFPGWFLDQSTKDAWRRKAGDYGLLRCNDADFLFTIKPRKDPFAGMTDEQIDALPQEQFIEIHDLWLKEAELFSNQLCDMVPINFSIIHGLVESAKQVGYNSEQYGSFEYWLFDHLAQFIKE
jgi:hypothetical protein